MPMALSIPDGVSHILGVGLPLHGDRVMDLTMMPPRDASSTKRDASRPAPNVPEATSTGLRNSTGPRRVASDTGSTGPGAPSHATLAPSRTGPSVHDRTYTTDSSLRPLRRITGMTHVMHAPNPQAMSSSTATCTGMELRAQIAETAASI